MLLGEAALAMWWKIPAGVRAEFEDWHSHEHFRERMGIAGFRRGSRWRDAAGGEGFFVMYELESYATLTSPQYLGRLNDPTPWSARMMPHHREMVRSQCRVLESAGAGMGAFMLTLRISPANGQADALRGFLRDTLGRLVEQRGITAAHVLRTDTPQAATTTEQMIRGGDGSADWIILVNGYEKDAVSALAAAELGDAELGVRGAAPGSIAGVYALSSAIVPGDFASNLNP